MRRSKTKAAKATINIVLLIPTVLLTVLHTSYFAILIYRGSTAVPYAAVLWSNMSISRQHLHPLTDSKSILTFRNVP